MLILQGRANIGIEGAERVSSRIREVLPTAENTHELAVERIETFTHPGHHGQKRTYALDTQHLELLRSVESDATEYQKTLTELAKDPKTLADNLRTGKDAADLAPDWLNESPAQFGHVPYVYDSLGVQRDWLRRDWVQLRSEYDTRKRELGNLRTRAAVWSLGGLVAVLAGFLIFGLVVPLADTSRHGRDHPG